MMTKDELKTESEKLQEDTEEITKKGTIDLRNNERLKKLTREKDYIDHLLLTMEDDTNQQKKKLLINFLTDLREELYQFRESKLLADPEARKYIDQCCEKDRSEGEYVKCAKTILDDFYPELKRKGYINLVYEGLFLANEPAR
ncbi:MAG: hypothetical protein WD038_04180 [Balneolales bacterium]